MATHTRKQQTENDVMVVPTVMSCTALRFNDAYDDSTDQQTYAEVAMLIDMTEIAAISQYAEFSDDGGVSKGAFTEIWLKGNEYPIVINAPYSEVSPIYMEFMYNQSQTHGSSK